MKARREDEGAEGIALRSVVESLVSGFGGRRGGCRYREAGKRVGGDAGRTVLVVV